MGWGKWVLVDFCRESEAKGNQLAAAPARGRGGAQGLAEAGLAMANTGFERSSVRLPRPVRG